MEVGKILERFKNLKIAVVGDLILDKYVFGKVERISPEAPVPVFEIQREEFRAGGAANVALNLKSLGVGEVALFGRLGDDTEGEILEKLLKEKGVALTGVKEEGVPTTRKTRLIARSQQLIRIDREVKKPLEEESAKTLLEEIKNFSPDGIVVSDYAKGVLTPFLSEELKKFEVSIFGDPRPKNVNLYKGFTTITPNRKEFEEIVKLLGVNGDFESSAKRVKENLNLQRLVITLGEKGIALVGNKVEYFPATAKEVYDVTGAGDTVIATLSATICAGGSWETACRIANIAAGIVVGKLGTATVEIEELKRELNNTFYQHSEDKLEQNKTESG
jgi:rfaE bifunctional protein kinase chain/domain